MNVYLAGLLWVLGAMIVAGALLIIVRKYVSEEHRRASDEAAARVFTVVAGLFAVLIAFVLINQFTEVNSARTGSYQEAASVVAVYWDADLLTPSARDEIRRTVLTYANTVVNHEWPAMHTGQPIDARGVTQLNQIHAAIASYVP